MLLQSQKHSLYNSSDDPNSNRSVYHVRVLNSKPSLQHLKISAHYRGFEL